MKEVTLDEQTTTSGTTKVEIHTSGSKLQNMGSKENNTSIDARPLYFAYGSNLSYSQMRQRCIYDPDISSKPVALARLDLWRWIICERGYANVIPPEPSNSTAYGVLAPDDSEEGDGGENNVVYGVLYHMTAKDESVLDTYEGIDTHAPDAPPHGPVDRKTRPKEQGDGAYNKWYLPLTVTKWLDEEQRVKSVGGSAGEDGLIRCLVYVDEIRVRESQPKKEYIARINRGVRESVELGLPQEWVDRVIRKFVPEGPEGRVVV